MCEIIKCTNKKIQTTMQTRMILTKEFATLRLYKNQVNRRTLIQLQKSGSNLLLKHVAFLPWKFIKICFGDSVSHPQRVRVVCSILSKKLVYNPNIQLKEYIQNASLIGKYRLADVCTWFPEVHTKQENKLTFYMPYLPMYGCGTMRIMLYERQHR